MDASCQTIIAVKEKCTSSINDNCDNRLPKSHARIPEENYDCKLKKRLNPKNKNDILRLRRELEIWSNDRRRSLEESNEYSFFQKQMERKQLMENDIKIRRKISSLGKKVMENEKKNELEKYFESLSSKWWNLSDGSVIQVETTKSKVLIQTIELYHQLAAFNISSKERIDLLHKARFQIQATPTQSSKDLIELLNRETDLLSRNITKGLQGLRQRVLHLFLKTIDEIQCNY